MRQVLEAREWRPQAFVPRDASQDAEDLQGVDSFMESNKSAWKAFYEARGEARGEAIGEARGKAIGEAIGEARGELNVLRRLIAKCLQKRLGGVPEQTRMLLEDSVKADVLESLLDKASEAEDLRAFLPQMEGVLRGAASTAEGS